MELDRLAGRSVYEHQRTCSLQSRQVPLIIDTPVPSHPVNESRPKALFDWARPLDSVLFGDPEPNPQTHGHDALGG